jgi:hypothetical protein
MRKRWDVILLYGIWGFFGFWAIVGIVLSACATGPCPTGAGVPCPDPAATCATACAKGLELGCEWAEPTPMDHPCVEVCQNAAETVPWDVATLSKATACP